MLMLPSLFSTFGAWMLRSQIGRIILVAVAILTWMVIRDKRKMNEAYKDAIRDMNELDLENADTIKNNTALARRNFDDGVRPYAERGWRE